MKYWMIGISVLALLATSCQNGETIQAETACYSFTDPFPPADREGSICQTDTCLAYRSMWQAIFLEQNNLSQEFFDAHIDVQLAELHRWKQGTSFKVCYHVQVDWAVVAVCDQFMVNIDPTNALYPTLDLPRGVNLSKAHIEVILAEGAFSSSLNKVSPNVQLQYEALEPPLDELTTFSGVSTLCFSSVYLDQETGHFSLGASAQYVGEDNACIFGSIDLVTGEKTVEDGLCYL